MDAKLDKANDRLGVVEKKFVDFEKRIDQLEGKVTKFDTLKTSMVSQNEFEKHREAFVRLEMILKE